MRLVNHGGKCCGIRHLYHFPPRPEASTGAIYGDRNLLGEGQTTAGGVALGTLLEYFEENENDDGVESRLVEVVLTDAQETQWRQVVTDAGFRKVVRFQNDNTGNFCNIYHYYSDSSRYRVFDADETLPAPAQRPPVAPPLAPAPARAERRHIFSTFHCVYRDGRRGAGYDTREAAETANPRARRVIERRIYSDGSTEDNVGDE